MKPANSCATHIDTALPGGDERAHLAGLGGQADEIEREPADERAGIGVGHGLEARPFAGRLHEPVDLPVGPGCVGHHGHRGPHRPPERPELATVLDVDAVGGRRRAVAWIDRTVRDPLDEICHLIGGEALFVRRHLETVLVADRRYQQARRHVARHDRGSGVAAGPDACTGVEHEAPLAFPGIGRVATVAARDQERADSRLEVREARGLRRRADRCARSLRRRLVGGRRRRHAEPVGAAGRRCGGRVRSGGGRGPLSQLTHPLIFLEREQAVGILVEPFEEYFERLGVVAKRRHDLTEFLQLLQRDCATLILVEPGEHRRGVPRGRCGPGGGPSRFHTCCRWRTGRRCRCGPCHRGHG